MVRPSRHPDRLSLNFWLLAAFLVLVFLMGGSARGDVQSLPFLRVAAIALCGYACVRIDREQITRFRVPLIFAAAIIGIVAVQLVPLPPFAWHALAGRDLIASIDQASGVGSVWRGVTMSPRATWNALYALSVPLAVLLLAIQLPRRDLTALIPVVAGLAFLSGLIGLIQVAGGHVGLYFYKVTNPGAAVGLFANRNHQALLLACLFPMLALLGHHGLVTRDQARLRWALVGGAALVLVPLILVTGSRAGLLLGVLALASGALLFRNPDVDDIAKRQRRVRSKWWPLLWAGCATVTLALFAVLFARAGAITRLLETRGGEDEMRVRAFRPVLDLAWRYFPFGSGSGTFEQVFKVSEPDALLKPTYFNHVHNDWIELIITNGIGGVLVVIAALIAWGIATRGALRDRLAGSSDGFVALTGAVILLLCALGSAADYPLRTPTMACIATLAAIWLAMPRLSSSRASTKTGGTPRPDPLVRADRGPRGNP